MASRRKQLEADLRALGNSERAAHSQGFFKSGKGQYGEGDRFLGIATPRLRKTALQYRDLGDEDLCRLLQSPYNEIRLAALEILVAQYEKGSEADRERIFNFYLANAARVNNWNLVDASARYIVGEHLLKRPRKILYRLLKSENMWERRIAMVSTLTLIWQGDTDDALKIAEQLLGDKHDLMHKAVGWMLREVGKMDETVLRKFLALHAHHMPRTALRYAIERFSPEDRALFLKARAEKDSVPARVR